MTPRKFTDIHDLYNHLDNEGIDNEEVEILGEDDIAMIHIPKLVPVTSPKPKRSKKIKPKK